MSTDLIDDDDYDPTPPARTRLGVTVAVIAFHILVIAGLIRAFTPDFAASVVKSVLSTFNVTVVTPPPSPPPPPPPQPTRDKDAGDAGDPGKKAIAKAIKAPEPRIPLSVKPAPKASSTGSADNSGAAASGNGTGSQGRGDGTGAGGTGNGPGGGGIVAKPSVRSGQINDSRDFPVPPGGRQTRFGKRVIVHFTVTTDGRARDCSVASSSVDADTTARVCPLVMQRIRFNPAKRADGTPVEARYGYKVDFTAR
ncbi:energy transducer TonB [Novosphingobium sp.]|uniref:energy transducer TonB n=1 Tax=Novosphingobium sp. TaxID=1874826 RepID=UPI00286B8BBA|nr:energy transducer TonB [Novosphingobium sp.]